MARPEFIAFDCYGTLVHLQMDPMTGHDMRFGRRVVVNRGQEPSNPTGVIADLRGLPGLLGL